MDICVGPRCFTDLPQIISFWQTINTSLNAHDLFA